MKDILKNWKSLVVGGALGAVVTVLGGVGAQVIKNKRDDKKLADSIESYSEIPSNEETQKED